MFKTFKMLALSALVGLGGIAVAPVAAQAQGLYLQFGNRHNGGEFGLRLGETGRSHRNWDRNRKHDRGHCSNGEAVNKASRMGLRRARIADTDRYTVTVRGRMDGRRTFVTFGRSGNCPVLN